MFQNEILKKEFCTCEVLERKEMYLRDTMTSLELVYCKKFCKENFVLNKTLLKPLGYAISTREAILSSEESFSKKMLIKPATMMNLISIIGREQLSIAFLLHQISIMHF